MVLRICPRELRADLCDGIRVFHRHALAGQSFSSPVDFSQQPGCDALPTPNLPLILSTLHFAARRTSIARSRGSVIIDRYTSMRIFHRRARSRGPMGPFRPLAQRSRPLLKPAGVVAPPPEPTSASYQRRSSISVIPPLTNYDKERICYQ